MTIVWANETAALNTFNDEYGVATAPIARAIVNRAITNWNAVIDSFNYAEDSDTDPNNDLEDEFQLTVVAKDLGGSIRGSVPVSSIQHNIAGSPWAATVELDDNAGGLSWFFDTTPNDDVEFTGIADTFSASFVDSSAAGQAARDDFYRTVLHEIGHALGVVGGVLNNSAMDSMVTSLVDAVGQPIIDPTGISSTQLSRFESTLANPQFGVTATFIGGHIYEGDIYGVNNDPAIVFEEGDLTTQINFETHPNELMNSGRTVPAGHPNPPPPRETARQFISDLTVQVLADAYGYTVTLPSDLYSSDAPAGQPQVLPDDTSSFGTAHITLDSLTGTLLVQGLSQDPTDITMTVDDTIDFLIDDMGTTNDTSDDQIEIDISYTLDDGTQRNITRRIHAERVDQVLIAGNGGTDTITVTKNGNTQPLANAATVDVAFAAITQEVDYVVSSNEDAVDANLADNLFDLDAVVPGNQVSLRGAIQNANGDTSATIYVPQSANNYELDLIGAENGATNNDLDIISDITIIGAGAGRTVIDATGLDQNTAANDADNRIFHVSSSSGDLTLSGMTLTGGNVDGDGGAILTVAGSDLVVSDTLFINNDAFMGNASFATGGAIRINGSATITSSVFTDNDATTSGGAIYAFNTNEFFIGSSLFNDNTAGSFQNVHKGDTTHSLGNNLADADDANDPVFTAASDNVTTGPNFVATTLTDKLDDTFTTTNFDQLRLSAREGVKLSNDNYLLAA